MRDAGEFDAFYLGSSRRVLGQMYAMTGNRAEAEDAVAEAYLKAWDRWDTVRDCDSPEAWVRRVASRIAVSSWRKAVNRLKAHHREAIDQQVEGLGPDHVALVHALRQIPADSAGSSSCTTWSASVSARSRTRSARRPAPSRPGWPAAAQAMAAHLADTGDFAMGR